MAKRKTSCGNARRCSMLLTNVTRSASYERLPNHRLFPARSGLTSRFPLWHRCLRHLRSNKSRDAVGRLSRRSSLLDDPGAKFLAETRAPNRTVKNSLNYVSTCLRVVDTRRARQIRTWPCCWSKSSRFDTVLGQSQETVQGASGCPATRILQ